LDEYLKSDSTEWLAQPELRDEEQMRGPFRLPAISWRRPWRGAERKTPDDVATPRGCAIEGSVFPCGRDCCYWCDRLLPATSKVSWRILG